MKKLILFVLISIDYFLPLAQVQVFIPRSAKSKKSEHERALLVSNDGKLILGSNLGNIRLLSPAMNQQQIFELGTEMTEIRDLAESGAYLFAMQSNDTSQLCRIDLKNSSIEYIEMNWDHKPIFLDGLAAEKENLFLIGDPVANEFCTFRSLDGGLTWEATPAKIKSLPGEAAYAASGQTNQVLDGHFYFVSGGLSARFFHSPDQGSTWEISALPYPSCPTCGPYAMALSDKNEIVTVGGNYLAPHEAKNTCFYSTDAGKTWQAPKKCPSGYRSCVIKVNERYYACGTNGIDVSKNGGKTWKKIYSANALSMAQVGTNIVVSLTNGSFLLIHP
ncbi:MAG: hypothetical protein RLZZ65_1726 [Bacteroidota bacterium]|jgi:hypothetical protein